MRMSARDGRTVVVSGIDDQQFKDIVALVTQTANGS